VDDCVAASYELEEVVGEQIARDQLQPAWTKIANGAAGDRTNVVASGK
jgi:hypothetical protein